MKIVKREIYLQNASIISFSLSWEGKPKFRTLKGGVQLLPDYDGSLPPFVDLTHGKVHEIQVARKMQFPTGGILVFEMD